MYRSIWVSDTAPPGTIFLNLPDTHLLNMIEELDQSFLELVY